MLFKEDTPSIMFIETYPELSAVIRNIKKLKNIRNLVKNTEDIYIYIETSRNIGNE